MRYATSFVHQSYVKMNINFDTYKQHIITGYRLRSYGTVGTVAEPRSQLTDTA